MQLKTFVIKVHGRDGVTTCEASYEVKDVVNEKIAKVIARRSLASEFGADFKNTKILSIKQVGDVA